MLSDLRELWRFRELLYNLVSRDLKARYKHSVLGFLWSLVNPLVQVVTLTVVFKYVMLRGQKIDNYVPFLFVAFLPWAYFQMTLLDSSAAVLLNVGLLKRVYFPREILPLTQVSSNLVHFLLAQLVLFAYLCTVPIHFSWHQLIYLPVIILLQTVLLAGLSLIVSCISIYFEDIRYLITVALNLAFYASCIFYPLHGNEQIKGLADSRFAWVAYANPMVPLITLYRQSVLCQARVPDASLVQMPLLALAAVYAFAVFLAGYALFSAKKWEFAERV